MSYFYYQIECNEVYRNLSSSPGRIERWSTDNRYHTYWKCGKHKFESLKFSIHNTHYAS